MTLSERISTARKIGEERFLSGKELINAGSNRKIQKLFEDLPIGGGTAEICRAYHDGFIALHAKRFNEETRKLLSKK